MTLGKREKKKEKNNNQTTLPHWGLELVSVLRLDFRSVALPIELSCHLAQRIPDILFPGAFRISRFRTTRRARAHFIDDEATTVLLNKTHFFLRDRPNTKHRKRTADFGDRQSFHNLKRATQQETQRRPEWTSAPSFSCGSPKPYTLEPSWLQGDTGQVKVLFTLYHDHVVEGHGCFKTLQNGAHVLLAFKLLLLFLFDC